MRQSAGPAIPAACTQYGLSLRFYLCPGGWSVLLYLRDPGPVCQKGHRLPSEPADRSVPCHLHTAGCRQAQRCFPGHSDRGSQFTSADFRKELDALHMVQSFSKKGHPYDNAVMECFFKYLKKEELNRRHFRTLEQLQQSLVSYIAGFYNSSRPHSHNNGLSPNQMETQFFNRFTCPLY